MKLNRIASAAILALVVAITVGADGKSITVEGTLVDSVCYLKDNSLTGNDHGPMKACGTACLKGGSPAGVLTKGKKFHAVIAPASTLAEHVGQTVRVTGKENNGSILAEKVEVNQNGAWKEVKLGTMM